MSGRSSRVPGPENPYADQYTMSTYGAHFAEVAVHADTGEIRVPRMRMDAPWRRTGYVGLFAAAVVIVLCAEPFANALVTTD